MKHKIAWTAFFFATLVLSLAAVASAQESPQGGACTNSTVAGRWGTNMTGTLVLPTGAVPFAAVNYAIYDGRGNYSGTQTRSNNGALSRSYFVGTYTVNSDCTGTKKTTAYADAEHTIPYNTVEQDFVLVNSGKELFEIFTTLTLPNGTVVPAVITAHSIKMFPLEWPWWQW